MREIISHTSIRGIAALGVAFFHLSLGLPTELSPNNFTGLVQKSYTFVDLFFILSGFIIAMVYKKDFLDKTPIKIDYKNFFMHRFARIYPLHFATLLFMVVFALATNTEASPEFISNIIQNIFLVHAWGWSDKFIFNFPSWSVSAEFAAYLFFPLFAFYWRKNLSLIPVVIALVAYYFWLSIQFDGLGIPEQYSLLRAPSGFLLGMVVFHYRDLTKTANTKLLSLMQVCSILLITLIMHYKLNDCLLIILFSALILSTWEDRGAVTSILKNKFLHNLGNWSFSIYLLHIPVRNIGFYIWPHIKPNLSEATNAILFILTILICTVFLSSYVYRYFECPARDMLKNTFLNKRGKYRTSS